jgi:predicted transcriptional regulator
MDAAKKLEVLDWVMHLNDEAVFNRLLAIKEDPYTANKIVGYTVLGEPMTREQYYAKLERGEKDIDEGRFMTDDELYNDMKNW